MFRRAGEEGRDCDRAFVQWLFFGVGVVGQTTFSGFCLIARQALSGAMGCEKQALGVRAQRRGVRVVVVVSIIIHKAR